MQHEAKVPEQFGIVRQVVVKSCQLQRTLTDERVRVPEGTPQERQEVTILQLCELMHSRPQGVPLVVKPLYLRGIGRRVHQMRETSKGVLSVYEHGRWPLRSKHNSPHTSRPSSAGSGVFTGTPRAFRASRSMGMFFSAWPFVVFWKKMYSSLRSSATSAIFSAHSSISARL